MLRVSKATDSLPKQSYIVAAFTYCVPKVCMCETAESSADAKQCVGSLPRIYIHYSKDVLSSEKGY